MPDKSPQDEPYQGGLSVLKQELFKNVGSFLAELDKENGTKEGVSRVLRLHEKLLVERAQEVGGTVEKLMVLLMAILTNYANGQGSLELVSPVLEKLKMELWR